MASEDDASKCDSISGGFAWLIQVHFSVDGGRPCEISLVILHDAIEYRTIQHVYLAILDGRFNRVGGRIHCHFTRVFCARPLSAGSPTRGVLRLAMCSSFVVPGCAGAGTGDIPRLVGVPEPVFLPAPPHKFKSSEVPPRS